LTRLQADPFVQKIGVNPVALGHTGYRSIRLGGFLYELGFESLGVRASFWLHGGCSGLMKPDTHLGENARHIEVSDDQTTSCFFR